MQIAEFYETTFDNLKSAAQVKNSEIIKYMVKFKK